MDKMYTLQPDESINDHMKDSIDTINHIVELSIGCMRDLANPHEGTFIDMTHNEFMLALEHIRNTIEMLDELCDELEDDKDEIRQEYEEKVIQFFNRFMNADLTDETNYRAGELARLVHQLDNRVGELNQELEEYKDERPKLLGSIRDLTDRVHELDKELSDKSKLFELAKKFLHQRREQISRLEEELRQNLFVKDAQKKVIDEKEKELCRLSHEIWELQEQVEYWEDLAKKYADPDGHKINNPQNFCGNCKHFEMHAGDVGVCARFKKQKKYKVVDPDDASCHAFEPHKPDQPCCKACNRDDCDNCTLCPF